MLLSEARNSVDIERVAERVSDHDCPSFRAERFIEHCDVDVICIESDVDENWREAVLNNRINSGREACSNSDYFVAGMELLVTHFVRS